MDPLVMIVLAFSVLFLVAIYRKWHLSKCGKSIRGPSGLPFIGLGFDLNTSNVYQTYSDFAKKYGDIVQFKVFNTTVVSLNSEELIRKAFGEHPYKAKMNNRGYFFYADFLLYGAQSIGFFERGHDPVHNELRKGMAKAFHNYGEGVKEFEERVQAELKRLLIEDVGGHEFEFEGFIKRSLANLISVLMDGKQLQDGEEEMFWEYDRGVDTLVHPVANALLSTLPFLRHVHGPLRTRYQGLLKSKAWIKARYVDRQMDTYEPGKVRGIIDCLIKQQLEDIDEGRTVTYTYERIVCAALETVAAGILTTLSVLTNTMICLLHHPDYQRKIQQELDSVVGRYRLPQLSDKGKCPLTEAVVMEVMRYITPLPFLLPHVCTENMEFEGYHIAKGSLIVPNVGHIHMDEKIWGDPFTFRPERFLDDDGQLLPRGHVLMRKYWTFAVEEDPIRRNLDYSQVRIEPLTHRRSAGRSLNMEVFATTRTSSSSWLPFSIGRRQCVGEGLARSRIFLYITTLLQRWDFVPIDGKYGSCDVRETDQFQMNVTVRPKPFFCRVENRIS